MLPIKPALPYFTSDYLRNQFDNQFDKVFSDSYFVPVSPIIQELRTRDEEIHENESIQTEQQVDQNYSTVCLRN